MDNWFSDKLDLETVIDMSDSGHTNNIIVTAQTIRNRERRTRAGETQSIGSLVYRNLLRKAKEGREAVSFEELPFMQSASHVR
jgi:hypothetical protein